MRRTMLKSKIHRATVTQADLHYVGSLTVDAELMQAADLLPGEQVQVVDIDNGARLETYVIEGPPGSGVIGINGAAAPSAPGGSCHHHQLRVPRRCRGPDLYAPRGPRRRGQPHHRDRDGCRRTFARHGDRARRQGVYRGRSEVPFSITMARTVITGPGHGPSMHVLC